MPDRPNILIIMPDTFRADSMSCAGHPSVRTPNIDRIAAEGMRFANVYTTCPICMPARSSVLSGVYCHNHGQWTNVGRMHPSTDTYLRHLKAAGYHTAQIGKSHLFPHKWGRHLDADKPFMHRLGWDDVLEVTGPLATRGTDSIMTDRWKRLGCLDTYRDDYKRRWDAGATAAFWPSPMPDGEHLDAFVGRTAVEYLSSYNRTEPLLAFIGFGGPHDPWDPPADWAARYDPAAMDANKPPVPPGPWVPEPAASHHKRLQNNLLQITPEINGRIRALYYAKISHIDWWIGQIIDVLARRGQLDNTAIIFWSDHGDMLCDKGRLHKEVFYEESEHVPLIVRPPKCANAGSVCQRLTSLVDVFPTVLDLAACEPKPQAFGRSLIPLLADPQAPHHDAVFSEIDDRTMIRDERHKMVVDSAGNVLKLYDMQNDPGEEANLVGRHDVEAVIADLRDRVLRWLLATQVRQTSDAYESCVR